MDDIHSAINTLYNIVVAICENVTIFLHINTISAIIKLCPQDGTTIKERGFIMGVYKIVKVGDSFYVKHDSLVISIKDTCSEAVRLVNSLNNTFVGV